MRIELHSNWPNSVLAILIVILSASVSVADTEDSWRSFHQNPRAFMESHSEKINGEGWTVDPIANSNFSRADIVSKRYFRKKLEYRKKLISRMFAPTTPLSEVDRSGVGGLKSLVDRFLDQNEFKLKGKTPVFRLEDLEAQRLMSAELKETPWTGSYWPIYQGMIGARYASLAFMTSGTGWEAFHGATTGTNSLGSILKRGNHDELDTLSPSEKYDLLIGEPLSRPEFHGGFLTPVMWEEGKEYFGAYGKVESWMGLCHGWAPASFMAPRPVKPVHADGASSGVKIKFYPSDTKALITYLWAKSPAETRYLGERCNRKEAKTDPSTGRVLDPECFDVNPGIWHFVVANQIGLAKRSFVIDATYDYEVWNQPVSSYTYSYFNPQSGEKQVSLSEAKVEVKDFTKDKFKKYRSKDTRSVVGVTMSLSYVVEGPATHIENDSPALDGVHTVRYTYDLELNQKGEVIGGEWYTKEHPDFLWLPSYGAKPVTFRDSDLPVGETWTPDRPLPKFWQEIAISSAVYFAQPLSAILEPILSQAASHDSRP